MKAKIKLDKNAIQNFFIDHAEKIIFGFVLLGAVMIVYSAVAGQEKTDKVPADLVAKVNAANAKIKQSTTVEKNNVDIDKIAEMTRDPIKVDPYELGKPISPPLGKLEHPRGEPTILAVDSLRVSAGSGMFQISAAAKPERGERGGAGTPPPAAQPGAGSGVNDLRGQRWAVVTALVPLKKQSDIYRDTYCDCRHNANPQLDAMPKYLGYWVERLEITSPADAKTRTGTIRKK